MRQTNKLEKIKQLHNDLSNLKKFWINMEVFYREIFYQNYFHSFFCSLIL